jgi:hypothetical protein
MINISLPNNRIASQGGVNHKAATKSDLVGQLTMFSPQAQNAIINAGLVSEIASPVTPTRKTMGNKGFSHINNVCKTAQCPYGMETIYRAIRDGHKYKRIKVAEVVEILDKVTTGPRKKRKPSRQQATTSCRSRRPAASRVDDAQFHLECMERGADAVLDALILIEDSKRKAKEAKG